EYLGDETAFATLLAIEAELYDAYARDSLSPERRLLFEQKYLATPEQRWQMEFSRTLQRVPRPDQRPARTPLPWARLAAVTAVVTVLAVAVVLRWFATPQSQPEKPRATEQTPAPRPQVIITFELGLGITRDGTKESTLTIPANADVIRVTAKVDRELPESYGAVLRKPEGTEIWRDDGFRKAPRDTRSANVDIPATRLLAGY